VAFSLPQTVPDLKAPQPAVLIELQPANPGYRIRLGWHIPISWSPFINITADCTEVFTQIPAGKTQT
jgi:hypothetical protein